MWIPTCTLHKSSATRDRIGGVASIADIERLAPVAGSIEGVIAGRAVYEGTLDVPLALALCQNATMKAQMSGMTHCDKNCGGNHAH